MSRRLGALLLVSSVFSVVLTHALSPIHLEPRTGRAHAFVDAEGREILFHGSSAVVKGPPWYPDPTSFSSDISMAREDFVWMQALNPDLKLCILCLCAISLDSDSVQ
jgi:hypothetical protein